MKKKPKSKVINPDSCESLPPIEKAWDWNSTAVPEDGYSIEDLNFVIGEQVMFEKDFTKCVKKLFRDLYKEIKHGDKEHQLWLKDKIEDFIGNNPQIGFEKRFKDSKIFKLK